MFFRGLILVEEDAQIVEGDIRVVVGFVEPVKMSQLLG
jgi:hypothetical protein